MTTTAPATHSGSEPTSSTGDGILSPAYRSVTVAALSLVTLGAYENRATTTILPTVLADLHAIQWFGIIAGASAITYLVATTVAGAWTDHVGARRVLLGALGLFVVAQIGSGVAPTSGVLLSARALSGIGEGGLDIALIVLVADLMPDRLRAKVYAAFATAWILPSLIGPGIAGAVAQWWGWRAAFLLPLVLVAVATVALWAPLRRAPGREPRPWTSTEWSTSRAALVVAAAMAGLTWGAAAAAAGDRWALIVVALSAVALTVRLARVLPAGTGRFAPGIPAIVGVTVLVAVAFQALGAYLPLLMAAVHHVGPTLTGISLSVTGLFWALGSNIASRDAVRGRFTPGRVVGLGMVVMAIGSAGPLLYALGYAGLGLAMALWAVSATGMGLVNNTLSVELVRVSAVDERGRTTAARTVGAAVGTGAATAYGGALVAGHAADLTGPLFAIVIALGTVVALATTLVARRIDA
ncbi:MAG: MFS transporter [Nostocoides sp.]